MTIFLKHNIKYNVFVSFCIIIIICSINSFAQIVKKDTVYHTPFDTNKISNVYMLDNKSDTIGVQDFIWSDRRNLSEIMNDNAGYHIFYLGIGGRNSINYNNFDSKQIGIFRDGVQINDNFFGGFDEENISVSEIQKIEEVSNISSFLYGLNSTGKSLNIITKDAFQPTIFSQLRYSQDRYGALFADFSFNVPFSKKFNFIFGINSHFTDGYYINSSFNVWRGRFKFNYYASPKLNIKASFYHNVINRRLNEGLVYNTDDTLKNQNFAEVYSLGQYERYSTYYSDIAFTGNFLNDKNSLTKLIFYSNNSNRILRNGENGVDTGVYLRNDYHYIQYGVDLSQHIRKKFNDVIITDFMLGGNAYLNLNYISRPIQFVTLNFPIFYQYNIYSIKSKLDVSINNLFISGSLKAELIDKELYNNVGIEGKYKLINTTDFTLLLKGGFKSTYSGNYYLNDFPGNYIGYSYNYSGIRNNYYEFGFESGYKNLYLDAYQYSWNYTITQVNSITPVNGNYSVKYLTKFFDFGINANYTNDTLFPKIYLKSDVVYHNQLFKDRLDLKVGISFKYFSEMPVVSIEQENYSNVYNYENGSSLRKNFFNLDFYIGARIGTANINLTLANLLDNLNYTTAIYPYDSRGGFLSSISRFTIVWDFNR